MSEQKYVEPQAIAFVYIGLNDKSKRFIGWIRAYAERNQKLVLLKADPRYEPLRDDPSFQDLMRRVGLPQ